MYWKGFDHPNRLERFYAGEGKGEPAGKLVVQVVVPTPGRASLQQVFVDAEPYAEAMKGDAR
jgi:hypothetical protein